MLHDVDQKGLICAFEPYVSRPEWFIRCIKKEGEANYRSSFWINFDKFKPFKYFIVLFAEARTKGKIVAFGLAERSLCKRVKSRSDNDSFYNLEHTLKGDKDSEFKSYFNFKKMGLFSQPYYCQDFILIKNGKPITNLALLRMALYVNIPETILNEIENSLKTGGQMK